MAKDPRREFAEQFFAGQDFFLRMQQALDRLVLPAEQRHALTDAFAGFMRPGAQLDTMIELTEAFGPPVAQIEAVREQLAEQREETKKMLDELDRVDATLNRLAAAAEQLAAGQAMFLQVARMMTGRTPEPPPSPSKE